MAGWILLLALVGADGVVTQIENVGPFASYAACNDAGMLARGDLPIQRPAGRWERYAQHRIDWVCVATSETDEARTEPQRAAPMPEPNPGCPPGRGAACEALRAELRGILRENRRQFMRERGAAP
jgi:hypothetical protein